MRTNTKRAGIAAAAAGTLLLTAAALSVDDGDGPRRPPAASRSTWMPRDFDTTAVQPRDRSLAALAGADDATPTARSVARALPASDDEARNGGPFLAPSPSATHVDEPAAAIAGAPPVPGSTSEPGPATSDGVVVTVPRTVTVTFPRYEGGRPPALTPPRYEPGTSPSVEQRGDEIVIRRGESGTLTPPTVDRGEPGTLTPPGVVIS